MKSREFRSLIVAAAFVVLWRLLTFVQVLTGATEGVIDDPAPLLLLRGVMGLLFVISGVMVSRWKLPWGLAFAWYSVTYGLHWGGPVIVGSETELQTAVLVLYLVLSSVLSSSCLLLWLYSYPSRIVPRGLSRGVLVPPAVALGSGLLGLTLDWQALLATAQAVLVVWPYLATIAGLVLLTVSSIREPLWRRRRLILLSVLVAAEGPEVLASSLGHAEPASWLTLLFSAIPLAALALARQELRTSAD